MAKPTIADVLEAVQALSSHIDERFVTKDDLQGGLEALESKITTEIDRFVVLHQTLDVELVSLRRRCERIENRVGMN